MENNKNKKIIMTWDDMNFNPKEIGIIFITTDGHILYGKINPIFQDYRYRLGHIDIFEACVNELGIELSSCLDQMEYAWNLASDDTNIISMQIITPKDLLIVMNINSTDEQLSLLSSITDYFNENNYLFTADICHGNEHESIFNRSSTNHEFGLELEEFNKQLTVILDNLNKKDKGNKK